MLPLAARGLFEELHVLRIRAGPAAFDVMNPVCVQALGNAELVRGREIDAFTLRTVAQGRVVDFDVGSHNKVRSTSGRQLLLDGLRSEKRKRGLAASQRARSAN